MSGVRAGATREQQLVELSGASLCCGTFANNDDGSKTASLPLPPLHAIVTDFPQEHMDPGHDPVEGMLGMEVLDMFDVDFDFPKGRLRLWKPGTAATAAMAKGDKLVRIPSFILNETRLLGIRIAPSSVTPGTTQPFVGVIDCGASFSVANRAAAPFLGLPRPDDVNSKRGGAYGGPAVTGVGVDGRPIFPTAAAAAPHPAMSLPLWLHL